MKALSKENIDPVYTIGIAAKLTSTSVHAIRMYEKKGIILPFITETNRRLFSKSDIDRIKCIRHQIDIEGLNIAGIKALLATIPCWLMKPCSDKSQQTCDAFTNTTLPCWEAEIKAAECIDADCRGCQVYKMGDLCGDVKALCRTVYYQKNK